MGDSGAKGMVAVGVLEDPTVAAVCALHVAPNLDVGHIRYGPGVVMAGADRIILTVTGKSAHGATPHRGVDPILVTAQVLNQIQGFLAQQIDARPRKSSPSAGSRAATASTSWQMRSPWRAASATSRSRCARRS